MPRMELDEAEVELIKERRHRNAANAAWNEALRVMADAAVDIINDLPDVPDGALSIFKGRITKFTQNIQREIK